MYPSRPPQKTKFSPPSAFVTSMHFFTAAAAPHTAGSGLVHAPCMYRGCEKRLHVPHSSGTPVSACRAAIFSATTSKSFSVSSIDAASAGHTSRSWKQ